MDFSYTTATDVEKQTISTKSVFRRYKINNVGDLIFATLALSAACITLAALAGIIFSLFIGAWPAIHQFGLKFFLDTLV